MFCLNRSYMYALVRDTKNQLYHLWSCCTMSSSLDNVPHSPSSFSPFSLLLPHPSLTLLSLPPSLPPSSSPLPPSLPPSLRPRRPGSRLPCAMPRVCVKSLMLSGRGRKAGRRQRQRGAVGGERDGARRWQRDRRLRFEA